MVQVAAKHVKHAKHVKLVFVFFLVCLQPSDIPGHHRCEKILYGLQILDVNVLYSLEFFYLSSCLSDALQQAMVGCLAESNFLVLPVWTAEGSYAV